MKLGIKERGQDGHIFLTEIDILQVSHLKNVKIKLSREVMKHLILTGVNGCGKTTLLNAISSQIGTHEWGFFCSTWRQFDFGISSDKLKISNSLSKNIDGKEMYQLYEKGKFVQIYFPSDRKFEISKSRTVEAVDISAVKMPTEKMNYLFGQFLIYLYFENILMARNSSGLQIKAT